VRLFAAVYPPAAELERLAAALGSLPADVRPVPAEQWHLTTAFYGDVPEAHVPGLTARLQRAAARTEQFGLLLAGAGTFPARAGRARQVWAGVTGDVGALTRLAERCAAAGRREGLAAEARRYRPHLTLGRARGQSVDATSTVATLSSYRGEPWTVTRLTLVRSTLGAPVRHEPLAELPLAERR
jgi:2'-5' RNA ligase